MFEKFCLHSGAIKNITFWFHQINYGMTVVGIFEATLPPAAAAAKNLKKKIKFVIQQAI